MPDPPEPLLQLTMPAVPDAVTDVRHKVREHLQQFGILSSGAVELAVAEAVGNAALHAYRTDEDGLVEVAVMVDQHAVEAVIRDTGAGFLPNPEHQGGRYGVVLMASLADRFAVDSQPDHGTTVRMEFVFPRSDD